MPVCQFDGLTGNRLTGQLDNYKEVKPLFTLIHKSFRNYRLKLKESYESRGQVGVVLILITAMAVIFYAIILNLGKIAEHKTLVTVAATGAASYMASSEASFAEQLYQIQLGGPARAGDDLTVCGWTGVFSALIALAIIIAAIFIPPIAAAIPAWVIALAIVLAVASVGIQMMVVQPGLTALWNKITQTFPVADQFVEHGVSLGLQGAVNDPIFVDDKLDMDVDGMFGSADKISRYGYYYTKRLKSLEGLDPVVIKDFLIALQRFIYGYSDKAEPPETKADRTWALLDPVGCPSAHPCCGPNPPAECNPCCVPCCKKTCAGGCIQDDSSCKPICTQLGSGTQPLRPLTCPMTDPLPACDTGNPWHVADPNPFPYIYNPIYEDSTPTTGAFVSFMESMGKDDETKYFWTSPKGDHSVIPQTIDPGNALYGSPPPKMFRMNDTQPGNAAGKIYTFLYKIHDWGLDQRSTSALPLPARAEIEREVPPSVPLPKIPEHCIWYSRGSINPLAASGVVCPPPTDSDLPLGFPTQLDLPFPAGNYNGQLWVDTDNKNNCGPLAVIEPDRCAPDKVSTIDKILASDNAGPPNIECASWDSALATQPPALSGVAGTPDPKLILGRWKKGADRYCAYTPADFIDHPKWAWEKWPYYAFCPKHGKCMLDETKPADESNWIECECDEPPGPKIITPTGPATEWPDDLFDSFYRLNEFVAWARKILSIDVTTLTATFKEWYPEFATWFEPQGVDADGNPILGKDLAYMQQPFDGMVRSLRNDLQRWSDTLDEWLNKTSFQGLDCYDVWCIPNKIGGIPTHQVGANASDNACPGVKVTEAASFSITAGGVVGNPHSIAACLDYNANDVGANGAKGNSEKFKKCFGFDAIDAIDACNEPNCELLPRSLLHPDRNFDTNEFVVPHTRPSGPFPGDVDRFGNCLTDCHYDVTGGVGDWAFCAILPSGPTPWHGPAKTTILKYPTDGNIPVPVAGGGPNTAPQWNVVKSLENCRTGADANSCPFKYDLCTANVYNPCFSCVLSCNSCVISCDSCVAGAADSCQVKECRGADCKGICSPLSCNAGFATCQGHCTGDDSLTCVNACAGGTFAAPQNCECNLHKCKDAAKCNTLIGTFACDDFVLLNSCTCGTNYDTCVTNSNATKTACRSACPDVSTVRGNTINGEIVPYIPTPDPDCLELCRQDSITRISGPGGCDETFIACLAADAAKAAPPERGEYPGCPPCDVSSPPIGGISGAQCAASPDGGPQCGFQNLIDAYWGVCRHWNDANWFYLLVWKSWIMAQGECVAESRPSDGSLNYRWTYDPLLFESYQEAKNQIAKFQFRLNFLSVMENEAKDVKTIFDDGVPHFDEILDEAAKLTLARFNMDQGSNITLPNQAIYAWKSVPLPGKTFAPWHIVRAEAYVPGRCSGACGRNKHPEPDLPSIKSYTHAWGTRRCYALGDSFGKSGDMPGDPNTHTDCKKTGDFDDVYRCFKGGTAKAKVIRWDEDKDVLLNALKFANGIKIWQFRFHNPKGGSAPFILPQDSIIKAACDDGKLIDKLNAPDAFIINKQSENPGCWDELDKMLRRGVMSRACAEYFFHRDPSDKKFNGFSLKFAPCASSF